MSSLKWTRSGFTKSVIARSAAIGMSFISVKADSILANAEHIAGKLNIVCDNLSRNVTIDSNLLNSNLEIQGKEKTDINEFVKLCDPTINIIQELSKHLILLQKFLNLLC
jgi:hypothetical protein